MSAPIVPMLRLRVEGALLPTRGTREFPGAAVRGAFGRELRRSVCVTRAAVCDGCRLRARCAYGSVFDPAPPADPALVSHGANTRTPPAYVIDASSLPPAGRPAERGELRLTLFGPALEHRRVIEAALLRCLTDAGNPAYRFGDPALRAEAFDASVTSTRAHGDAAALELRSPLRIQRDGRPLRHPSQLQARDILMAAVKRVAGIHELVLGTREHGIEFSTLSDRAHAALLHAGDLRWSDAWRHSARQNRDIPLGGLVGTCRIEGAIEDFLPYLRMSEWLHIGKEAAFGLGALHLAAPQACRS